MLSWLEKSLNRRDFSADRIAFYQIKDWFEKQKIGSYIDEQHTVIEYIGDRFQILIDFAKDYPIVTPSKGAGSYSVPKIMYVPSERNLFSAISRAFDIKGLPDTLFAFAEELRNAQEAFGKSKVRLPLNNCDYEYDKSIDISYISGENYKVKLSDASSGIQSVVPLYLVSRYLSDFVRLDDDLQRKTMSVDQSRRINKEIADMMLQTEKAELQQREKIAEIRSRFFCKRFFNIVEEPEQNLYPDSQQRILYSLLEMNHESKGNQLLITTHSPYMLNYLTLAVKAGKLYEADLPANLKKKVGQIVPESASVSPSELGVYEFDDAKGTIKPLALFNGLPSDGNQLNEKLVETNELFATLLEIEQAHVH